MITRKGNVLQFNTSKIDPKKAVGIAEEFEMVLMSTFPKSYGNHQGVMYFNDDTRAEEVYTLFKKHFGVKV